MLPLFQSGFVAIVGVSVRTGTVSVCSMPVHQCMYMYMCSSQ